MGQLEGVNVEKLQGGLGRLAIGTDNHVALVLVGLPVGAVATAINNAGKGVVITSIYAAEQLGLTESFDANNNIKAHEQISDFFRLAPEATLYLFDKVTKADLKGFINQNKEIKGYAVNEKYVVETPNIITTVNAHQEIINEFATENRLIDFCVVGMDNLTVFTENLFALTAPNVSVLVACKDALGIVATGAFLGMLAVRRINENAGSVDIQQKPLAKRGTDDYPLTDSLLNEWPEAFLSSGLSINSIANQALKDIIAKGFIVAASYEGYAGVFFENSYTCIDRGSDFAFIENNRTWNKAARIIRATLLPRVKGVVKKDPATGFIAFTTVSSWTQLLNKNLDGMVANDEISGYEVYINPNQIVNSTAPLKVKASVVADGIVHAFEVALGLTNSI